MKPKKAKKAKKSIESEPKAKSKKVKEASKSRNVNSSHDDDDDSDLRVKARVRSTPDNTATESVKQSDFTMIRRNIERNRHVVDLLAVAGTVRISKDLMSELRSMFVTSRDRDSGTYSFSGVDPTFKNPRQNALKIAETVLTIQAHRDRAVSIQLDLFAFLNRLTKARRAVKELIQEQYGNDLKRLGALTIQGTLIDAVRSPLLEKQDKVEMYLNLTDRILKNLDSSHFSFREAGVRVDSVISRAEGAYGGRN